MGLSIGLRESGVLMKKAISVLTVIATAAAISITPVNAAQAAKAATKPKEYAKVLTGMDTNVSIQLLRVVRANVAEFGRNNIVVIQYRLRKEGPNLHPGLTSKAWFDPIEIKLRNSSMGDSYETIRGIHEHHTCSGESMTNEWTVGRQGDGYAWFKVPDDVTTVDIFFPFTHGYMGIPVEIPKA